jgi:2,5-diketo-D-gluconate reductase A
MKEVKLNNGVKMPVLGLGTYGIRDPQTCVRVINQALKIGYRRFDTAQSYGNEAAIGTALKNTWLSRKSSFITDKLNVATTTYKNAKESVQESLDKMGLDYFDLLLIHHPYNDVYGAWRAMREMQKAGQVRAIGISNFQADRVEDLVIHGGGNTPADAGRDSPLLPAKKTNGIIAEK